jgi:hypothetical protein
MGAPAKRRKLSQNQIAELIWDSQSDEVGASIESSSEDEGGFEDQPGVSHLQPDYPTSSGHPSSSQISASVSEEEEVIESGPGQQVQMPFALWTCPSSPWTGVVHTHTGDNRGEKTMKRHT